MPGTKYTQVYKQPFEGWLQGCQIQGQTGSLKCLSLISCGTPPTYVPGTGRRQSLTQINIPLNRGFQATEEGPREGIRPPSQGHVGTALS